MIDAIFYDNHNYFEAAVQQMDDELREELHDKLAPCSDREFLEAYEEAHYNKFGVDFAIY